MSKFEYTFPTSDELAAIERRARIMRAETIRAWTKAAFNAARSQRHKSS
ncbi:MAG: RSP_7527 family protein [Alphaproteobacteria bacterium]